jgi:chromosome segregation ATPase
MVDSLPTSLTAFVVILAGSAMAMALCGVLIGALTQRYRKQFLETMQKYIGARDEHKKAMSTLEKTMAQMRQTERESTLVSHERNQVAGETGKLQDLLIARERKVNDLTDEVHDLKSKLDRQVTAFTELEKLAKQQQTMLSQAAERLEQTHGVAFHNGRLTEDRDKRITALEARLSEAQSRATTATQNASRLQQVNAQLETSLAQHEQAVSRAQRDAHESELRLASGGLRGVADAMAQSDRHSHTIAELNSNLGQARERLEELERERNVSSGDLAALSDRLRKAEQNASDAGSESRERLEAIQNLSRELAAAQMAMRDAQLMADQHAAMNNEQLARNREAQDALTQARRDVQDRDAMITSLSGQLPAGDAPVNASFNAEVLTPEQKSLVNRVKTNPGNQGVLAKMAAELLAAQRELGNLRGRMDEISATQNTGAAASDPDDLQHLRDQLESSRGRQSEQSEKISALLSRVKDLEKRYEDARKRGEDLQRAVGKIDGERKALADQVEQRKRFPTVDGDTQDDAGGPQLDPDETDIEQATARGLPGADTPRFVSQSNDLPRFVQQDERIAMEPPLESVRGLTPRDVNALRAAAIMTVSDLAALTPQRLETIVKPTLWRKPDYQAMLRQAKQLASLND